MNGDLPGAAPTFVCPACWYGFADGWARACPDCAGAPPAEGWPSMPCSFRGRYVLTRQIGRDATAALFHAWSGDAGEARVLLEVARASGPLAAPSIARKLFRREATLAGLLGEETDAFFSLSSIDVTDTAHPGGRPGAPSDTAHPGGRPGAPSNTRQEAPSDLAYIAFEHVPWPALGDVLAETGPFSPVAAARVGVAILHAVSVLERHRLVHRALAPSRIFVLQGDGGGCDVKIAGFGAWPDGAEGAAIAPSPEVLPYASPEQLRGEALTSASDVHMVASIVWELVTGQVPHPVAAGAPPQGAALQRLRRLARVPARPATMPPELYDLLAGALHPDPRDRCPSDAPDASPVAGLGSALERFAEDFPTREERELAGALRELGATTRALATLSARLAPLRAILDRKAEIDATVQRLATDASSSRAVRTGAGAAEEALAALEADVERILSPGRAAPSRPAPAASEPPPSPEPVSVPPAGLVSVPPAGPVSVPPARLVSVPPAEPVSVPPAEPVSVPPAEPISVPPAEPAAEPVSVPPAEPVSVPPAEPVSTPPEALAPSPSSPPSSMPLSFPPPSNRPPPDSMFPRSPQSMPPGGTSTPPDSLDIPGLGKSRWPYVAGALVAAVLAVVVYVLAAGSKETAAPSSSASLPASASPAPVSASATPAALRASPGAPTSASTPASAAPHASASAAPAAGSTPSASASAAPPPRPRPRRAPPPDEEPAAERPPDPE